MGRTYYIIDSIKGGCGKTTFSIMLSQWLEEFNVNKDPENEQENERKKHVCLLDFDFLGTGLINLFLTGKQKEEFEKNYIYITDKIRDFQTGAKKYIYTCETYGATFYIGFSNPDYKVKKGYRVSSQLNYTPAVNYGVFRKGVQNILAEKETGIKDKEGSEKKGSDLEGQIDGEANRIVLDMSPGMDTYSEMVKECLFDKKHSGTLGDDSKRFHFLMTGMDLGHISATQNYFKVLTKSEDKMADKFFIVINDPMRMGQALAGENGEDEIAIYTAVVEEFKKELRTLEEVYQNKIWFLVLNHFDEYAKAMHERIPFCSKKASRDLFAKKPIRFWGAWKDNTLKELVSGVGGKDESEALMKCLTE